MGHPQVLTPNIDRLAAEGTQFCNCLTSSPVGMPARATRRTGPINPASGVRPQGAKGHGVDDGVSLLDVVPTLLDLAGVDQPQDRLESRWQEAGVSLAPTLPEEVLTLVLGGAARPSCRNALIENDTDPYAAFDLLQYRSLVTNEWKLVFYAPTNATLFFGRRNDPGDLRNLAQDPSYPGVVLEMFQRLTREIARTERRPPRHMGC